MKMSDEALLITGNNFLAMPIASSVLRMCSSPEFSAQVSLFYHFTEFASSFETILTRKSVSVILWSDHLYIESICSFAHSGRKIILTSK